MKNNNKLKLIQTRLTIDEDVAFNKLVERYGESRSRLIRKMIREAVNGEPDLLTDEQSLLKIAIRQLIGIANNLNQVTMAIHAGLTHRVVDEKYLSEVFKHVIQVKLELQNSIKKTKCRWVKNHAI